MEDFALLLNQGIIHEGCQIVIKGTVRVENGQAYLDSVHDKILVDGISLGNLCEPNAEARTAQGQLKRRPSVQLEEELVLLKNKVTDLTKENESLSGDLKEAQRTIGSLREKLQVEHSMRVSFQDQLTEERQATQDNNLNMLETQAKLAEKTLHIESLRSHLDSTELILGEDKGKLHSSQEQLDAARRQAGTLHEQVKILNEDLREEQIQNKTMLRDFNDLNRKYEQDLAVVTKELEDSRTTIITLKNELEIAELEEREYQATINDLQKNIEHLQKDLVYTALPPGPPKTRNAKSMPKTQSSFRKLLGNFKPKKNPEPLC